MRVVQGLAQALMVSIACALSACGMLLVLSDEVVVLSDETMRPAAVAARVTTVAEPTPVSSHYLLLDADERSVYDAICQGVDEGLQRFVITIPTTDAISDALHAVVSDHPEYFWLTGACTYRELLTGEVEIELEFNVDANDIPRIQAAIDAATQTYVSALPAGASAYEKVRAAYEWIITETDYGYGSEQHQNIQSVFCDHVSVCAGYAKAFQYLLNQVDVSCIYVRGTIAEGSTDHAWNIVWIDGTPTYVDVTWGDPTYATASGEATTGNLSYDYLCVTTAEMERAGHVVGQGEPTIACTSDAYDYFRLNGLLFETYDKTATDAAFDAAFDAGANRLSIKFTNDDAYFAACAALDDTSLLDGTFVRRAAEQQKTTDAVRYQTATSDALRIVTVLW